MNTLPPKFLRLKSLLWIIRPYSQSRSWKSCPSVSSRSSAVSKWVFSASSGGEKTRHGLRWREEAGGGGVWVRWLLRTWARRDIRSIVSDLGDPVGNGSWQIIPAQGSDQKKELKLTERRGLPRHRERRTAAEKTEKKRPATSEIYARGGSGHATS